MKEKEPISFRGDRDKWFEFTYRVKKNKKRVWGDYVEPMIDKAIKEFEKK